MDRSGKEDDPRAMQADELWALDNFDRGQAIRKIFAASLPYDFPVLARWQNGEAMALHSLDLTAPTYQDKYEFEQAITRLIERLASFKGATYVRNGKSLAIADNEILARRLVLVVPENGSQDWLETSLDQLKVEAASLKVDLDIRHWGTSRKYSVESDSKQSEQG